MPRRKLQFSLLTLFVAMTVCALGLTWWFNRPPEVDFRGEFRFSIKDLNDPALLPVRWSQRQVRLRYPRGDRDYEIALVVILPPGEPGPPSARVGSLHTRTGEMVWYASPSNRWASSNAESQSVTVVYNARANTATLEVTTLPCPPNSVIVLRFDEAHQPHLSVDDGTFADLESPDWLREELRRRYEEMFSNNHGL